MSVRAAVNKYNPISYFLYFHIHSLWVDWVLRLANSERHWNCTAHFRYRGSIEYRDIVIVGPISVIAQHYTWCMTWNCTCTATSMSVADNHLVIRWAGVAIFLCGKLAQLVESWHFACGELPLTQWRVSSTYGELSCGDLVLCRVWRTPCISTRNGSLKHGTYMLIQLNHMSRKQKYIYYEMKQEWQSKPSE